MVIFINRPKKDCIFYAGKGKNIDELYFIVPKSCEVVLDEPVENPEFDEQLIDYQIMVLRNQVKLLTTGVPTTREYGEMSSAKVAVEQNNNIDFANSVFYLRPALLFSNNKLSGDPFSVDYILPVGDGAHKRLKGITITLRLEKGKRGRECLYETSGSDESKKFAAAICQK